MGVIYIKSYPRGKVVHGWAGRDGPTVVGVFMCAEGGQDWSSPVPIAL